MTTEQLFEQKHCCCAENAARGSGWSRKACEAAWDEGMVVWTRHHWGAGGSHPRMPAHSLKVEPAGSADRSIQKTEQARKTLRFRYLSYREDELAIK